MPTTPTGLVYPASTDHTRLWEHFQALATSAETPLSRLLSPAMAQVRRTAFQQIPHGTPTPVAFDYEDVDSVGSYSAANPTRYTAQSGYAGWYQVSGGSGWASNATGSRGCWWRKNGVDIQGSYSIHPSASGTIATAARVILVQLAVGDYVELIVFQTSGGPLNTGTSTDQASMTVRRVSL